MKATVIPIVTGALSTVTKGLVKGLEGQKMRGRVETIQTTALLRSLRIPRELMRLAVTQTPMRNHQLRIILHMNLSNRSNL